MDKRMKKKTKKTIIILSIIGIILILGYLSLNNPENFKINLSSPFSIVGGTSGVSEMDLTITVENTGNVALTCTPLSATPTAFNSALDKTSKIVPITGTRKVVWTSNKISVAQFEGNIVRFGVTIRCYYNSGQSIVYLPDKESSLSLDIMSESSTSVNFRTTDLTYSDSSAIAYTSTCGGALTQYGEYGGSHDTGPSGYCADNMPNNILPE